MRFSTGASLAAVLITLEAGSFLSPCRAAVESPMRISEMLERQAPAWDYACVSAQATGNTFPKIAGELTQKLIAAVQSGAIHPTGLLINTFHGATTDPDKPYLLEQGLPVAAGSRVPEGFALVHVPARQYATVTLTGNPSHILEAYLKAYTTLAARHLQAGDVNRQILVHWEGPESDKDVIEVQIDLVPQPAALVAAPAEKAVDTAAVPPLPQSSASLTVQDSAASAAPGAPSPAVETSAVSRSYPPLPSAQPAVPLPPAAAAVVPPSPPPSVPASVATPSSASEKAAVATGDVPVQESDTLLSHPDDPDRMAKGVLMPEIVPKPALRAAQAAVAQFPREARFQYELGRALEASEKRAEAFAAYQKAAEMGYRMAFYNVALCYETASGTAADPEKAKLNYARASKQGITLATSALQSLVFDSSGFSNPNLFQAIYDRKFDDIKGEPGDIALYLTTFVEPIMKTDGAQGLFSREAYLRIAQKTQANVWGKMLGGMAQMHRNNGSMGDAADFGQNVTSGLARATDVGQADAQLFHDRYAWDAPVTRQFFENLNEYCLKLRGGTFMHELERNAPR